MKKKSDTNNNREREKKLQKNVIFVKIYLRHYLLKRRDDKEIAMGLYACMCVQPLFTDQSRRNTQMLQHRLQLCGFFSS